MAHFSQKNRTARNNTRRNAPKRGPKGIEIRYNKLRSRLRALRLKEETKDIQVEIAHEIDTIERHGFSFFPYHYIYDNVQRLHELVESLESAQTTTVKKAD